MNLIRSVPFYTFPSTLQAGPSYEPNSFGGPAEDARFVDPAVPLQMSGEGKRYNHREGADDYSQVRTFSLATSFACAIFGSAAR